MLGVRCSERKSCQVQSLTYSLFINLCGFHFCFLFCFLRISNKFRIRVACVFCWNNSSQTISPALIYSAGNVCLFKHLNFHRTMKSLKIIIILSLKYISMGGWRMQRMTHPTDRMIHAIWRAQEQTVNRIYHLLLNVCTLCMETSVSRPNKWMRGSEPHNQTSNFM